MVMSINCACSHLSFEILIGLVIPINISFHQLLYYPQLVLHTQKVNFPRCACSEDRSGLFVLHYGKDLGVEIN
jgi:hypothetical protein